MDWDRQHQQHPFNGPLSGTTQVNRYQKGKTNLDLLEQEIVSGSGIRWAICKYALGRMPFLPSNQQHQSTEGTWMGIEFKTN